MTTGAGTHMTLSRVAIGWEIKYVSHRHSKVLVLTRLLNRTLFNTCAVKPLLQLLNWNTLVCLSLVTPTALFTNVPSVVKVWTLVREAKPFVAALLLIVLVTPSCTL